ncbi:TRAP transporter substrate-binding protein [Gulosibacter sp. 10]|uniref:TRAP transporter substrate-binding protein n=1 Tax=Gulosibacter sp. 10 TaxID=1255570 RepID=UPI00097F5E40|nr:TRAP transporter substrate-binding protein DctP [Gulosibacter sp. 10]SJM71387.1 TRAP transporter solute receptor, unknown substrate 3 [Gulosibacter sp. 10]
MSKPTSTARRLQKAALAIGAVSALLLSGCAEGGGGGGNGSEFHFTLATSAAEGTPNAAVQDWYLDRIEEASEGRITFERTTNEALCVAEEIVECIRDGRADIGVTIPDYTPQYFPTVSVVGIPFLNQNSQAVTAALYDLHTTNEAALASLDSAGLHYVSAWPVGRFLIGTPDETTSVADLAGLQARASGPVIQEVLAAAGMNINAITASETYEAVERGVITTVGAPLDFPVNYGLMELIPHWADPGVGQYSTFGMWFSQSAYESLPDDLKQVVDDVTAEFNGGAAIDVFNETAVSQCDDMLGASTVESLTAWDESATEEWREQVGDSAEAEWQEIAESYGLEDAAGFLDAYKDAYAEHEGAEYSDTTSNCVEQFADR